MGDFTCTRRSTAKVRFGAQSRLEREILCNINKKRKREKIEQGKLRGRPKAHLFSKREREREGCIRLSHRLNNEELVMGFSPT